MRFAAGLSGGRSAADFGAGTSPAVRRAWYSGSSFRSLPTNIETIAAADDAGERRRHADHQDLRQAPLRHALLREEADHRRRRRGDGLAVIACCEAIVATAIGRSGRMPLWCAVS